MVTKTDELVINTELEKEDVWIRFKSFDLTKLFFIVSQGGVSVSIPKKKVAELRDQLTKLLEVK